MRERNEDLDCLKGIAILLVMFGHVQVHNRMTDPYLYDVIKSLQMPLFMLISGYLAGCGRRVTGLRSYGERIARRAQAYLLPFFSWLVLQHMTQVPEALKRVLFQLDYGLWFLMCLFLFTLLVSTGQLFWWLAAKTWGDPQRPGAWEWVFWLTVGAGCLGVLAAYLMGVSFLSPALLVTYLPYYVAACFVGLHREWVERLFPVRVQRVAAVLGALALAGMAAALDLVTVTGIGMLCIQTLASFLGCFALIRLVLDWRGGRVKGALAALGGCTLEVYVLHYHFAAVLNPAGRVYTFWSREGLLYSLAAFCAMSALTAAGIWLIRRIPVARVLLFGKR